MFADQNLSKYQRGFRKGFSTQYSLVTMLERLKGAVDDKKVFGALWTDLSKAFDCLSHELIIAKPNAYGFNLLAIKVIYDYLSNSQQRTKINHDFSSWEKVLFGVPQDSVLEPVLFNIFLSDLFHVMKEIQFINYADDNSLYNSGNTIEVVISSSQESSETIFKMVFRKSNPRTFSKMSFNPKHEWSCKNWRIFKWKHQL